MKDNMRLWGWRMAYPRTRIGEAFLLWREKRDSEQSIHKGSLRMRPVFTTGGDDDKDEATGSEELLNGVYECPRLS